MLNVQNIQLAITVFIVGGVIGFLVAIPYLKKKGINIDEVINKAQEIVNTTSNTLDAIEPVLPPAITNNLDFIEKWAKIAVGSAEQLYHSNQLIDNNQKKQCALDTINTALKAANITPSDGENKLINNVIEYGVNELGHANKTDAEKEAEKQTLQNKVSQLTDENSNLKATISNITNSINNVTPSVTQQNVDKTPPEQSQVAQTA